MTAMNNSLINLLQCLQRMHNDTTNALQFIKQSQQDHSNDSLIGDSPILDRKHELYFDGF